MVYALEKPSPESPWLTNCDRNCLRAGISAPGRPMCPWQKGFHGMGCSRGGQWDAQGSPLPLVSGGYDPKACPAVSTGSSKSVEGGQKCPQGWEVEGVLGPVGPSALSSLCRWLQEGGEHWAGGAGQARAGRHRVPAPLLPAGPRAPPGAHQEEGEGHCVGGGNRHLPDPAQHNSSIDLVLFLSSPHVCIWAWGSWFAGLGLHQSFVCVISLCITRCLCSAAGPGLLPTLLPLNCYCFPREIWHKSCRVLISHLLYKRQPTPALCFLSFNLILIPPKYCSLTELA